MYKQVMDFVSARPVVPLSLAFILGIILQSLLEIQLPYLLMLLISILVMLKLFRNYFQLLIIALLIILGSLRLSISTIQTESSLALFQAETDSTYRVRGIVSEIGVTRRGNPKYKIRPHQINESTITDGSLILYTKDLNGLPDVGDTLDSHLLLNTPRKRRNPHEFDYRKYLKTKNVYFEAFLADTATTEIRPSRRASTSRLMAFLKSRIKGHFDSYLTPRSSGILSALILGERSDVDDDTRNDFANTGVIHVLAVSGLHVGYVSLILMTIFGLFRLPHKLKMIWVIIGLAFYVLLTGGAASVMRASMMAALLIIGGLIERKTDVFNILSAAALIILLIQPGQLFNIGFQLSFSAVISIVTLFPVLKNSIGHLAIWKNKHVGSLLGGIADLFLVSLAAQLGTLAVTIFYFHKIPIISLLANLIVVPLIGIIVATGMAFLLLGMLSSMLAGLWAATLEGVIDLMLWVVQVCAQFDWAYITTRSIHGVELLLIQVSVFCIIVLKFRRVVKIWIIILLFWGNFMIWQNLSMPQRLEVAVLDVGQGDAIIVHTPQGKTMVVDVGLRFGGRDIGKDVVLPFLQARNYSQVDLLVLTHPHNDHIGGAEYLVTHIPVKQVLMPDIEYESYGYKMLQHTLDSLSIPMRSVYTGDIDTTLNPLKFRVTGPRYYDHSRQPSNVNNTSIVMQLFYGESTLLLTGDAEEEVEHDQLLFGELLRSDLLKAPHHGSKTSSSMKYLSFVNPAYSLISLGDKNKFKHPAPQTIERYENIGSQILRTDHEGAILYRSDGKKWAKVNWK